MSQSEDYLDGLLNSINKAKTDAASVEENVANQQKENIKIRQAVSPEDDFFQATGIRAEDTRLKTSHPFLREVFSEDDFLRQFEEEIANDDRDSFIESFEQEIDDEERYFQDTGESRVDEDTINSFLDNIKSKVTKSEVNDELEEDSFDSPSEALETSGDDESSEADESSEPDAAAEPEEDFGDSLDLDSLMDSIGDQEVTPIDEGEGEDSGEDSSDDLGFSLDEFSLDSEEEPLDESSEDSLSDDDSLKEFMPDEMDALDAAQFGDGDEVDLSGESGLDLDNLLGEDEELSDLGDLLSADGDLGETDIDESAEGDGSSDEEPESDETTGKKKKGKKKKGDKKKGEKKPNPFLQKLALIFFGPPDEDELAEMAEAEAKKQAKDKSATAPVEITLDEDGNPIVPEGASDQEDGKKKKKKEKKPKEPKPKKEKKAKPPKPPKPKKEKKPKKPDNSPKIPLSIIATFLVLSISIIGIVVIGMNFMGLRRHMQMAELSFENKDYIEAYEYLNGYNLTDEDHILMRNQARVLADVQQCQKEYESFIAYKQYDFALDALVKGVGRYEKYKDNAEEYGISEEYNMYGELFVTELAETFSLSKEDALFIYNQENRHYYTVELRKVLIKMGYEGE
ncbi:MAG: hypothetical protein K5773_00650 [Pseudobutyrivibrio sp.]|nr:hypothetical protein [Pseudobutyrivibrio sp.]